MERKEDSGYYNSAAFGSICLVGGCYLLVIVYKMITGVRGTAEPKHITLAVVFGNIGLALAGFGVNRVFLKKRKQEEAEQSGDNGQE